VTCDSGYSPIEQILECDQNGVLEEPEACGLMACGELFTPYSTILCTTEPRLSSSQVMNFHECDKDGTGKYWETFRYPNEFYIQCDPGYKHFPLPPQADPHTKCSANGTYTRWPECLDFDECQADVFGPVITPPPLNTVTRIFPFVVCSVLCSALHTDRRRNNATMSRPGV